MTILVDLPDEAVKLIDARLIEVVAANMKASKIAGRVSRTSVTRSIVLEALGLAPSLDGVKQLAPLSRGPEPRKRNTVYLTPDQLKQVKK